MIPQGADPAAPGVHAAAAIPADRFDLYDATLALRRAIRPLVAGAVVAGIATAAATYFAQPYVSEGMLGLGAIVARDHVARDQPPPQWPKFLQYGKGMSLPELKTEYARLDGEHFRQFLDRRNVAMDSVLARVVKRLASAETRPEILNPQFGSTRADQRELGEQAKIADNSALGVRIAVVSRDPQAALNAVRLLGDFVVIEVFGSQARGLVARRLEQHESQKLALDNDLLVHRFNIATTNEKVTRLRALQREFPEVAGLSARQVVSVAEGGARYLSPSAQVVGLEATMSDLRQQIATTDRWRKKADVLAAYYRDAQTLVQATSEPGPMLKSLEALIERVFARSNDDDAVREARNEAALDLHALRTLHEYGLRFVSGPTAGWRDDSRIWKYGLVGAAAGLLIVAAAVLLVRAAQGHRGR